MHNIFEKNLKTQFSLFAENCVTLIDTKYNSYAKGAFCNFIDESKEELFDIFGFKKFILNTSFPVDGIFFDTSNPIQYYNEINFPFKKLLKSHYPRWGTNTFSKYGKIRDDIEFDCLDKFFNEEKNIFFSSLNYYKNFFPDIHFESKDLNKYQKQIDKTYLNVEIWLEFIKHLMIGKFCEFEFEEQLSNKKVWFFTKRITNELVFGFLVNIQDYIRELKREMSLPEYIHLFYSTKDNFYNNKIKWEDRVVFISKLDNPFFSQPCYLLEGFMAIDEYRKYTDNGITYINKIYQLDSNNFRYEHHEQKHENIVKFSAFYYDVLSIVCKPYIDYIERCLFY